MKLRQWVLFIDMLGYGNKNTKINSDELADKFIGFMQANAKIFKDQDSEEARERYKNTPVFNLYAYYDIQVTFVSDSLIINYFPKECENELKKILEAPIDRLALSIEEKSEMKAKLKEKHEHAKEILILRHSANTLITISHRLIEFIRHCLEEENIFVRGGISNKYCKIENQFAVGEGVIEAFNTESKIAIEPRICLSESVLEDKELMDAISSLSLEMYNTELIKEDYERGVFYLDYLASQIDILKLPTHSQSTGSVRILIDFLKLHKEAIEINLSGLERKSIYDSVKSKYLWLKKYHNDTLNERILREELLLRNPADDAFLKKTLRSLLIE